MRVRLTPEETQKRAQDAQNYHLWIRRQSAREAGLLAYEGLDLSVWLDGEEAFSKTPEAQSEHLRAAPIPHHLAKRPAER